MIGRHLGRSDGAAVLFNYYDFLAEYHREPRDMADLFDGLRASAARWELAQPQSGGRSLLGGIG